MAFNFNQHRRVLAIAAGIQDQIEAVDTERKQIVSEIRSLKEKLLLLDDERQRLDAGANAILRRAKTSQATTDA